MVYEISQPKRGPCEIASWLRNDFAAPCTPSTKIFAEKGHGAAKSFRSQGAFSQPSPDFAASFLGLQNYFAAKGHFRRGLFWAAKSRRPWFFSCSLASFDSQRPSFNFFAIPLKLNHSKILSYI